MKLYPQHNLVDRETALRLYTHANTWFSNEEGSKGQIKPGQLADLVVLSDDYFAVPEDEIRNIVSMLTMVGGNVVHGDDEFKPLAPELPPAMPDWSPVRTHGGYHKPERASAQTAHRLTAQHPCAVHGHAHGVAPLAPTADAEGFWGALGCACWAF
jgi:hypothetical protein